MTVQLASVAERPAAPEPPIIYNGSELMADVRAALKRETRRYRVSEHERDALTQAVALAALERPALTHDQDGNLTDSLQRRAALALVTRELLRDSRTWRDTVDGWRPRERTERTERGGRLAKRPKATLALSVAEQAERYRSAEAAQDSRPSVTSTDALAARWNVHHSEDDGPGTTDWLSVAAEREREVEQLPPAALAEHQRELVPVLIAALDQEWSPAERQSVSVALLCHAGENLTAIAQDSGVSIATAKRRSASGTRLVRSLGSAALRAARREAAETLGIVAPADLDLPDGAMEWARVIDAAIRAERVRAGSVRVGQTRIGHAHGEAREVLAYLSRVEAALSAPAVTYSTSQARPAPSYGPHGYRHPASARPDAPAGDAARLARLEAGLSAALPIAQVGSRLPRPSRPVVRAAEVLAYLARAEAALAASDTRH